ncbi:PGF-pre-PGF domain-containing protein [Methanolobus profundi]|uniref:PGF-pre-PGF domain-containing protein n=1 Tax=Methanolobus profundi TaxID=487685 RepID=A0A1I4U9B2_9EURY|nr:PGF-pre-PGF domain-containing protein [Methanolobus profundi]SFM85390.1 PGF-pre-PGF domain-containing protein [Methanolobus profundi]
MIILFIIIFSQTTALAALVDTPVLDVIGDRSVSENSMLTFTLSAEDPENDTLTFSSPDIASLGATLDASSGLFEWTPTYDQAGSYLVQFVVSDGSYIDSEYITITVNNANRLPVFSAIDDTQVDENVPVQLTLEATDEDSDILAFSKDASFGTLEGNVFTWTPDYDDQGEHTIVFSVTDGSSSVTQTALINVSNVNRAPVLYSVSDVSVPENTPVTIQLNGFDADGDDITYSVGSLPAGAVFDENTGLFQWSEPGSAAKYVLTFSVSDGIGSDSFTSMIVIDNSNSAPVMDSIGSQSIDENSELSFEITAADDKTKKLSFSFPDGFPSDPTVTMGSNSIQISWIPSYEEAGSYKTEFKVSDGTYSTYQVVDIVVNDVNRAPVIDAVADYSVIENGLQYINMSATDQDGDTLTYSTNSSLGIVRGNTFICTTDYTDAGVYTVEYTVSDGILSNSTTAKITVTDSNMPPKLNSISPREAVIDKELEFSLSVSDEDEGQTFSYKALDLPVNASLDEDTGTFEWTPSSDDIGDYSVSFYVSDSSQEDYETVSITVTETSSSSTSTTSSSSGGGGGGSMTTGELYENIVLKDYVLKSVIRETETVFSFEEEANSITSISFTSKLNAGQVKAMIEMLKGTSSLVDEAAPGTVYKNLNIWVGDSKFSSDTLSDILIEFKVERSWIESDDRDPELVELYRYSDSSWNSLETSLVDEDEDYFYYETETPGFSSFAIVIPPEISEITMSENSTQINETMMSIDDEIPTGESGYAASQESKRSIVLFLLIGVIGSIVAIGYKYRSHYDELYKQIGNPDGKRYRRLKK